MRGDLLLQIRLMVRPRAIVGLVAALSGAIAVASLYLPWYEVRAHLEMLGETRSRMLAALAGWEAHPWLWAVGVLGVAAVALGLLVATDRAPKSSRALLAGVAAAISGLAGASALLVPPMGKFAAEGQVDELTAIADHVPDDVVVQVAVETATGIWVALAAAGLILLTAVAARR
jgi:hypothetical protein